MSGLRWRRPFAEGEDALTVNTMPDKVEYEVGEYFDITGLTLKAKYKDGGVEILTVADSWVSGYDMNKAGEQTITVSYNGGSVTFTVTVRETAPEADGGCGSTVGAGISTAVLLIGTACVVHRKKER